MRVPDQSFPEIPTDIIERVAVEFTPFCEQVCRLDPYQAAHERLNWQRCEEQWKELSRYIPEKTRNLRLLEIGSGYGLLNAYLHLYHQIDAWGIEPGNDMASSRTLALDVLTYLGVDNGKTLCAVGETLPFPDESFDIVYSTNVLEHVYHPGRVIAESIRVLKPEGICQCVVPNYGSWWEGHYGVLWVPYTPRWLGKLYVSLYNRDPSYVDTLQLINRPWLERILRKHRQQIEVLGWGDDIWEQRVRTLAFSEWAVLGKLKGIVRWVHRLQLVEPLIWLGKRLHWETPLILTFRKRAVEEVAKQQTL